MRNRTRLAPTLAVLTFAALALSARSESKGQEWPQYLGPARNGATPSTIPANAKLTIAWRAPVPTGRSGFAVAGDRVYTVGADETQEMLVALDAARGVEVWRTPLGKSFPDAAYGPAATPAVAGDLVIALGSGCQLHAVRAATGEAVWRRDFAEEYKSRFAAQGACNMSPLVASGRVIVPTGAREGVRIAAFESASGRPLWTAENVPNSLSGAPGLMEAGGSWRVLYHHAKPPGVSGISALDVQSGAIAWQFDGKASMSDMTPVALPGDRVLMQTWSNSSMYDTSAAPRELWTNDELSAAGSPPVVHGDYLYGFGGNSTEFLKCVEAATGKVRWSNRIYRGFAALAGDTLVVISEASGFLRLIGADPAAYRELSRLQVLEPGARTGTPPAIVARRIYVRNLEEVVAVDAR